MATLDGKSKSNSPSIADGSMAYMPKPDIDEKLEGEDEIRLDNNKKEETKTMADIAEELGGDKITNTPQADTVQVEVDDKPKKAAAKKDAKPAPEVIEPEVIDDGNIPPALVAERSQGEKGGGKGFLIFLFILALVAAGIFGYLWWSEKQHVAKLQSDVDKLTEANKGLSGDSSKTSPATTATSTRLIPELGLTYAFGDDVKTVTYRFRETTDSNKQVHKVITFSTTKVVEAERKVSNSAPKCTAEFSPLGALTSYTAGSTYKGGKIEEAKVDNESIFKFGDTYYVYEAGQSACSTDASVQEVVMAEKTAVQAFVKSLKEQE